ncbi:hypothetical protein ACQP0C_23115 [Nocardia sp. CA-129566]|uniref:hypothetical protein n=1 Tax=Nocardia sp. CA-129566 TaxID=3239976 RepID=UPI003D9829A6
MFKEILTVYGKPREPGSCAFGFLVRRKGLSEAQFSEYTDFQYVAVDSDHTGNED